MRTSKLQPFTACEFTKFRLHIGTGIRPKTN